MKDKLYFNAKYCGYLQVLFHFVWLSHLSYSESFRICYYVMAAASLFSLYHNQKHATSLAPWQTVALLVFSCIFSLMTLLSNHEILWNIDIITALLLLLGGMSVGWNICVYIYREFPKETHRAADITKAPRVFFSSFAAIAFVDLAYLFFVEYPGNLSPDSINQINQILTGVYSNHHPYWHTMIIKVLMELGVSVFGNYNDAVALYSVCQVLYIAACFSYAVVSLYQFGVPRKVIMVAFASYILAPYHINYSIMMWKDVVFSGAVLVFVVSLFRIYRHLGKYRSLNFLLFAVSSIGFGVLRSNGWMASVASFLLSFFVLKKQEKKALLVWAVTIIAAWGMKGPWLAAKNIPQPDLVESLSIPVQQVARVFADGYIVSPEEAEMLNKIINVDEIPQLYISTLSDPIKDAIRAKDNAYFEENIRDYFQLWLELGKRFPTQYFRAWVDQTKGYWNSGYLRWVVVNPLPENAWGIHKTMQDSRFAQWFAGMLGSFEYDPVFQLFFSIGFHVWLVGFAFMVNLLCRKKEALLCIPNLMIIGTLLVATPVSYEFRYAYTVFTSLQFLIPVTLYDGKRIR